MLKLVIRGWINCRATLNNFLHVELCGPRIMKININKGKGKESFQSYEISSVKFTLLNVISRFQKY